MRSDEKESTSRPKKAFSGVEGYARNAMLICSAQLLLAKLQQEQSRKGQKTDQDGDHGNEEPSLRLYAHEAVLHAVAEIVETYVKEIGRYSRDQAELAGRTQANLNDVLGSLEKASLVTQISMRELALYSMSQEISFPRKLANFPPEPQVKKRGRDETLQIPGEKKSDGQSGVSTKRGEGPHIDSWMPPFPPAYTYISTPLQTKGGSGSNEQLIGKQRRQTEKELVKLTRHSAKRTKRNPLSENPFLRPPRSLTELGAEAEEPTGNDRDILEPDDAVVTVANALNSDQTEAERDLKRLRVERILASSSTVGE